MNFYRLVRSWGGLAGVFISLAVVGCSTNSAATTPTSVPSPPFSVSPPPGGSVELEIVASVNAVVLGHTLTLSLVAHDGGEKRTLEADWSTSNSSVASVNPRGVVNGISLGSTVITASFGGQSTTMALNVVHDFSGTWRGQYVVEKCTRLSGAGTSYCRFTLGAVVPFDLSLTQLGARVSGTMNSYTTTGEPRLTGSIQGLSGPDGELGFSGSLQNLGAEPESTLIEWKSAFAQTTQSMTGSVVRNREFTNAFGLQKSREECVIRSAARS
jgi:hypothetical protein